MLDTDNLNEATTDDKTILPDLSTAQQAEAHIVTDAMCLATVSGLVQSGMPFGDASTLATRIAGDFFDIALKAVCNNLPSPETYLLVTLGDQNRRERRFADCKVKLVTDARVLEYMQRLHKERGTPHMSLDASLTLESAMLFVNSNREGGSDASNKKH